MSLSVLLSIRQRLGREPMRKSYPYYLNCRMIDASFFGGVGVWFPMCFCIDFNIFQAGMFGNLFDFSVRGIVLLQGERGLLCAEKALFSKMQCVNHKTRRRLKG